MGVTPRTIRNYRYNVKIPSMRSFYDLGITLEISNDDMVDLLAAIVNREKQTVLRIFDRYMGDAAGRGGRNKVRIDQEYNRRTRIREGLTLNPNDDRYQGPEPQEDFTHIDYDW